MNTRKQEQVKHQSDVTIQEEKKFEKKLNFQTNVVLRSQEAQRKAMFASLRNSQLKYSDKKDEKHREALKKTEAFYKNVIEKKDNVIHKLRENVQNLKRFIEEDNHYHKKLIEKQNALTAETEKLKQNRKELSNELNLVKTQLNEKELIRKRQQDLEGIIQEKEAQMKHFETCFLSLGSDFFQEIDQLENAVEKFQNNDFFSSQDSTVYSGDNKS